MSKEPAKKSLRSEMMLKAKSLLKCKDSILDAACYLLGLAALLVLIAKAPEMHSAYIRSVVGSRVYKVQATLDGGGGTGFQVKAPSGANYVVTNSHVCEHVLASDNEKTAGTVILVDDDGNWIRRHVVAVSDQTDLCLIEGAPGVSGLSLGSEPQIGSAATVVGHPFLRPTTLSSGEIVGKEDVKIVSAILGTDNPFLGMMFKIDKDAKCNLPKQEVEDIALPEEMGGGHIQLCLDVTSDAYMTSITIYPGNSGSPMVDYMGHVIGVAFAANERDNAGEVINLNDLKTFLAHY